MREAEIAWAAGLYEGEGTVGLTSSGIQVALKMCDEDVVRRWGQAVGFGKFYGPHQYKGCKKPQCEWRVCTGDQVVALLEAFRPWLGKRRIEQLEKMIANRQPLPRGLPPGPECGRYTEPTACANGYLAHKRHRESPCATCRKSLWLYQKARKTIGT